VGFTLVAGVVGFMTGFEFGVVGLRPVDGVVGLLNGLSFSVGPLLGRVNGFFSSSCYCFSNGLLSLFSVFTGAGAIGFLTSSSGFFQLSCVFLMPGGPFGEDVAFSLTSPNGLFCIISLGYLLVRG